MDYTQFSTVKLSPNKLDIWIKFNQNVMLIGEKGVGKSSQIIDAFERNNLKWKYFSGATLDPWTDLIGIPKAIETEKGSVIEYVRPSDLSNEVEAIFCDEFNRAHKKVKNALMELIQFKSINGRKFPNLKIVWAAINPDKDEEAEYDVDPMDPAQLDRFHVIVNLPYAADKKFFSDKFSASIGTQAVLWWEQQSDVIKNLVSPRRLEYAVTAHLGGMDVSDILPRTANITMFKTMMRMNPTEVEFNTACINDDTLTMERILNNDSTFQEIKKLILGEERYYVHIATLMHNEKLAALFKDFSKFSDWVRINPNIGKNKEILDEMNKTVTYRKTANMHNDIEGILASQNAVQGNNPKEKILSFCRAANTTKMKITSAEYQAKFKNTFSPIWLDYMTNHIESKPMNKMELSSICEYFVAIHTKLTLEITRDRMKQMIKDIIKMYKPLTFPQIIMEEDTVFEVLTPIHSQMSFVADAIFGIDSKKKELKDLK